MNTPKRLNPRQTALALHVATGGVIRRWCQEHGIPEPTARTWCKKPEFRARVVELQAELQAGALGRLIGARDKALDLLDRLLAKPEIGDRSAVAAIKVTLEQTLRLDDHLLIKTRLEQLEARLDALRPPPAS